MSLGAMILLGHSHHSCYTTTKHTYSRFSLCLTITPPHPPDALLILRFSRGSFELLLSDVNHPEWLSFLPESNTLSFPFAKISPLWYVRCATRRESTKINRIHNRMGSACCTDQRSAIDVRNKSSTSSGTNANHVQGTPFPSPILSPTHMKRDDDNKPRHVANPLSRAANPTLPTDVSDGATNDMQSPVAVSPAARHTVASNMDVLSVPNGRQKTAAVMWQTSPVSSPSPPPLQQLRKESSPASAADAAAESLAPLPPHALVPYHHERTHSRSGRGHASSFATFTDGAANTSGVESGALSMHMSGNQAATLMQQAEFAAVSTSTDDTASLETHTNGGGVFPSLQAQFSPASNRQRSSFFTATGTNSSTLGNLLSGEPSLDGFMTAQRAQSTASHHHHHPHRHTSVVQMVEVIPQTTNLPLDSNDASWVGRGSMSLHSASGRPTNHNHQSTTSFAGPSAVAVPATENRLRLATFATQRN